MVGKLYLILIVNDCNFKVSMISYIYPNFKVSTHPTTYQRNYMSIGWVHIHQDLLSLKDLTCFCHHTFLIRLSLLAKYHRDIPLMTYLSSSRFFRSTLRYLYRYCIVYIYSYSLLMDRIYDHYDDDDDRDTAISYRFIHF